MKLTLKNLFEFLSETSPGIYEFRPTALLSMERHIHPSRIHGIYRYVQSRNKDGDWAAVVKTTFDDWWWEDEDNE